MAPLKPSKEPDGEETSPSTIAGYNNNVDAIREKEFPMLQGRPTQVHRMGLRDLHCLQERSTSTMQAQLYTPNL